MAANESGLSPAARSRLEQELAQLRKQRASTASPTGESEAAGDSADRADFLQRAEAAAWLDQRIAEVTDLLARRHPDRGGIPDRTTVTLRFDDGTEETLRVVSVAAEWEDEVDAVTADSPLGRALVGREAGDTVSYRTPAGEVSATVVAIESPA